MDPCLCFYCPFLSWKKPLRGEIPSYLDDDTSPRWVDSFFFFFFFFFFFENQKLRNMGWKFISFPQVSQIQNSALIFGFSTCWIIFAVSNLSLSLSLSHHGKRHYIALFPCLYIFSKCIYVTWHKDLWKRMPRSTLLLFRTTQSAIHLQFCIHVFLTYKQLFP